MIALESSNFSLNESLKVKVSVCREDADGVS